VAKRLSKRASKPPKSLAFGGLNVKFGALLATESAEKFVFTVLSHHFQMMILSDWRIIFEKRAEVFVSNMSKNNNLSHFSYRCHILGESNSSLSPNFRISEFPCLTHVFEMQIPGK
jgi:hypothetical protein